MTKNVYLEKIAMKMSFTPEGKKVAKKALGAVAGAAGVGAGAGAYAALKKNKGHDKEAGAMDAAKNGAKKFSRAFQGHDVKDLKGALKRTPVDKENLVARMDLGKRLGKAKKQTMAARGAVAGGVAATGVIAAKGFKHD